MRGLRGLFWRAPASEKEVKDGTLRDAFGSGSANWPGVRERNCACGICSFVAETASGDAGEE
jgi:hypothetical protein